MKTIGNKETEISKGDSKMTYADLVLAVANSIPRDGINAIGLRERFRLIEVAEKGGESLSFEDSDFSKLKELTEAMRWAVVSKDIIDFCDAVLEG